MSVVTGYLVVSGGAEIRATRRQPRKLAWDEVAFPLRINVPDVWGRVQNIVTQLSLPEPEMIPPEVGERLREMQEVEPALD